MSKLSRRETLARGGQVVAAAAVLPFIPSIAQAQEDAELFALYDTSTVKNAIPSSARQPADTSGSNATSESSTVLSM